ncbi:hypothetical protein EBZ39_05025 [bacterium]|nr:hypothetical protein [bacterium]
MESTLQFERPVEEWFTGQYSLIPERMQDAIKRYVIDRVKPGSFLTAVITNNLRRAFDYADDENVKLIGLYVQWFTDFPPALCWGDEQSMNKWLRERD